MDIVERFSRYEGACDSEVLDRLRGLEWFSKSAAEDIFNRLGWEHSPRQILSRSHATHDPYVIGHYDTPEPLVHAGPRLIAGMPKRYLSQDVYKDFPPDIAFTSFFVAQPQQVYFADEMLEEILGRKRESDGVLLKPLERPDPVRHFETHLRPQDNPKLGTLMYQRRFITEEPVFTRVDAKLESWLDGRLSFNEKARKKLIRAVFKPEVVGL